MNRVIELIETKNITQTNNLIKAVDVWVADQLGLKNYEGRKKKDPWWKRRIEEDIKQLKKDINIHERVKKGQIGACKEGKAKLVEEKYRLQRKSLTTVIGELKQRILAKAAKISRYEQRIQQYNVDRLFKERKFTMSSMDKQGVVTETYQMLKKVGHFGVEYGV